ncbi:hypothetical protein DFH06DRAFT_1479105, partial [Mycena polygramma]
HIHAQQECIRWPGKTHCCSKSRRRYHNTEFSRAVSTFPRIFSIFSVAVQFAALGGDLAGNEYRSSVASSYNRRVAPRIVPLAG